MYSENREETHRERRAAHKDPSHILIARLSKTEPFSDRKVPSKPLEETRKRKELPPPSLVYQFLSYSYFHNKVDKHPPHTTSTSSKRSYCLPFGTSELISVSAHRQHNYRPPKQNASAKHDTTISSTENIVISPFPPSFSPDYVLLPLASFSLLSSPTPPQLENRVI